MATYDGARALGIDRRQDARGARPGLSRGSRLSRGLAPSAFVLRT